LTTALSAHIPFLLASTARTLLAALTWTVVDAVVLIGPTAAVIVLLDDTEPS
jgi:hypothetical protein